MKFSLQLPSGVIEPAGEFQTGAAIMEMASAIEAAGAQACWVTDHPAPDAAWVRDPSGHDAADPFVVLTFAAAATTRLRLHTSVLILPYRNPFLTAKAVATLEVMSGGRMILGVGGGYLEGEFSALGVDFRRRGALLDEALETMMAAWSGESVVKKGQDFDARGVLPRPHLPRPPAVWIGGSVDKTLDRVAKWGTGWNPVLGRGGGAFHQAQRPLESIADLKAMMVKLRGKLEAAGRTDTVDVCVNFAPASGSSSSERTQHTLDRLGELATAGVNWVAVSLPHPSRAGFLDEVRWFGAEVIARADF